MASPMERRRAEELEGPTDRSFWQPTKEGYQRFLQERRKRLATAINEFINTLLGQF